MLVALALGTDYNILMIARLREQAREGMNPRDAAAHAIGQSGPTIGAAGLILAGAFASLTLAGNTILAQAGFAVSCGIVLAAFVMSMFFSPSLTALIGDRVVAGPRRPPAGAAHEIKRHTVTMSLHCLPGAAVAVRPGLTRA